MRGALLTALLAAAITLPRAAGAEPGVALLSLPFAVEEMRGPGSYLARALPTTPLLRERVTRERSLVAVWGEGQGAALVLEGGEVRAVPFAAGLAPGEAPLAEAPRDAIPGARRQSAGPLTAYLAGRTTAYRHGVLGDQIEASRLVIQERRPLVGVTAEPRAVPVVTSAVAAHYGSAVSGTAGYGAAVFEDLEPRLADLDGDGTPEIIVVHSTLERGAALVVVGREADGTWTVRAETPAMGQPHRWLNPAGVGDLDGDGRPEIVLVRSPHLEGVLQAWRLDGASLTLVAEAAGYANHALGSTALELAAVVDLDGDRRAEVVVPTLDRTEVAVLSLRDGRFRESRRLPLPARAEKGLAVLGSGREVRIVVGLEDGRLAVVRP